MCIGAFGRGRWAWLPTHVLMCMDNSGVTANTPFPFQVCPALHRSSALPQPPPPPLLSPPPQNTHTCLPRCTADRINANLTPLLCVCVRACVLGAGSGALVRHLQEGAAAGAWLYAAVLTSAGQPAPASRSICQDRASTSRGSAPRAPERPGAQDGAWMSACATWGRGRVELLPRHALLQCVRACLCG